MINMTIFKTMLSHIAQLSYEDVFKKIQASACNNISFDAFDTLIKRNVDCPTDLFTILEKKFNTTFNKNYAFSIRRLQAECEAHAKNRYEEVTLEEIYVHMSDLSEYEKNWLYQKELELELRLCQRNFDMGIIYDWCIANNKSVFIISDMYLSENIIVRILHEAGYAGWKAVYVSSKERIRKSSGNLFKRFLEKEKIEGENLIHIGDSIKGDYIMPKKYGICAYLIPQKKFPSMLYRRRNGKSFSLDCNVLESFIINNGSNNDFYQIVGYSVLGPILYGYTRWLYNELSANNIDKVFFLTREGALLKAAFDMMYPDSNIESRLISVSRSATAVPLLQEAESFHEILTYIFVSRAKFSLMNFYESCGLSEIEIEKIEEETCIVKETPISKLTMDEKNIIFNRANPYIIKKSQEQKYLIKGYLENEGFNGKVAVADVGWHGTIQNALQKIFPENEIYGFYVGRNTIKNSRPVKNAAGFLFDDNKNKKILREVMFSVRIFEIFFLSTDGSTISYGYDKNKGYYPIKRKPEQTEANAYIINMLQNAALRFVNDFNKSHMDEVVKISADAYYRFYKDLVNPPRMRIVNQFENFIYLAVEEEKLAAQRSLTSYLLHPLVLKNDFLNNSCKLFFLKSLFKLPLPYFEFLCCLKKFDK